MVHVPPCEKGLENHNATSSFIKSGCRCLWNGRPSAEAAEWTQSLWAAGTTRGEAAGWDERRDERVPLNRATVIAAVMDLSIYLFIAVMESTGGISPPLRSQTRRLAERTKGRGAVDRTNYGLTHRSTRSFEVHHKQRMSLAAVNGSSCTTRPRI